MGDFTYAGSELEIFAHARNWKRYWSGVLEPFIGSNVLEVGSGIGANTAVLAARHDGRWTCLEPDGRLLDEARRRLAVAGLADRCAFACGTLSSLDTARTYDTIMYIDVLEHIEDDRGEMECAAEHLADGGSLIVLAPAHQALYTPFDRAVGHFRRYDKGSLAAVAPTGVRRERLFYIDSVGLCASVANKLLLRQGEPTIAQIKLWDRAMIPLSRVLDRILFRSVGKSIVGIWRKDGGR